MTRYIATLVIVLILIAITLFFVVLRRPSHGDGQANVKINDNTYFVDVVTNTVSQAKGLSGRDSMASNAGMLFIFPSSSNRTFWMKGMKFDIDIIWINKNKVIGFSKNASAQAKGLFQSSGEPDMVLELNAGTVQRDNIKVGDMVYLDNAF